MDRYVQGKGVPVEASSKLDGVYARATAAGVVSKSGKPLDLPHVGKRLKRYFRKHPAGALEGELYRKGADVGAISGEVRAGGVAAKRVKLHVYPGQKSPPLPFGAVRRVKGRAVKDDAGVEKAYTKALRKGHEGVVIRTADGKKFKKKPQEDREWPVVGTREAGGGKRKTVLTLRGDDGRPFKVQSAAGVSAKAGDQVNVRYSGLTPSGKPKAAVAQRVRNDHDFAAATMTDKEQDQLRKDRKTLLRGTLAAGVAGAGALYLLKKGRGGVRRYVPPVGQGSLRLPAPVAKAPSFRNVKTTKTKEVIRIPSRFKATGPKQGPRLPTKAERAAASPVLGPKAPSAAERTAMKAAGPKKWTAAENQARKGGVKRANEAVALREKRAWGALKPATPSKLSRATAKNRDAYAALDAKARVTPFQPNPNVTAGETARANRAAREKARQELQKFRKTTHLSTMITPASKLLHFERERSDNLRDGAVAAGALGSGGAAIYTARKLGRTADAAKGAIARGSADLSRTAGTVNRVAGSLTPKEIARQVGADVSGGVKRKLKGYFPTFIKGGKKLSKILKHTFETPASRLIDFDNGAQVRDPETRRYTSPVQVYAGMAPGYTRKDANNQPIREDLPLAHAQVLKAAYNKGKKVQRVATRGGSLAKDAAAVVTGKPRAKDAAGRTKKREWEKSWFKEGVKNVATGAAILGGATVLRKSPRARKALRKAQKRGADLANKHVPDYVRNNFADGTSNIELQTSNIEVKREFATPAASLFGKLEKPLRKGALGKFMGPSAGLKAAAADRAALVKRLKAAAAKGNEKAAGMVPRAQRHAAMKNSKVKLETRRQKDAVRSVKKGAVIAGGGALAGGALMKAHADQPEDRKVHQGARLRNALVGAAAGSFLGGGLAGGKSGFKGARVGAALGGLTGLLSNPKRRAAIDDLQTASFSEGGMREAGSGKNFETPASRLIEFMGYPEAALVGSVAAGTGYGIYRGAKAVKDKLSKTKRKERAISKIEGKDFETPASHLFNPQSSISNHQFDATASDAGWDVRDPRGRSARVFAPGSRRRVRREKTWAEKKENERKLWKAGLVAAGVAGLAGGHLLTKKLTKKIKVPVAGGFGHGPKLTPRASAPRSGYRPGPSEAKPRWS